jgi:hypothetical protein
LGPPGIVEAKIVNICLMAKQILRNKYLKSKDLLVDYHRNGSHFWNAIQKERVVFCLGAKHDVHNNTSIYLLFE